MSFFFKNVKRFSILFTSVILAVTLTAGSFAVMANGLPDAPETEDAAATVVDVIHGDMSFDGSNNTGFFDESAEPLPIAAMSFNLPKEMKAAYLVPGSDFIKTKSDSADTVKAQIDTALESVQKYGLNTVVIDTVYGEQVIYNTYGANSMYPDFDVTEYITNRSREAGLFVYAIFDASAYSDIETLDKAVSSFAETYRLDGILTDGYEGKPDSAGYGAYIQSGGSMGYDNFLNQRAASIAKTVSQSVRRSAPDTQAGILVNPVWANIADNKDGSDTNAEYTSLGSGYADTKRYIELGWFDFVAVKANTTMRDEAVPFSEIASWWSKLAEKKSIPLYIVYSTGKVGSDGWTSSTIDEQLTFASNENAYQGAMFSSLKNIPGTSNILASVASVSSNNLNAANLVKPVPATPAPVTPAPAPAPVTPAPAPTQTEPETEPEPEPALTEEADEELWQEEEYYDDDESQWGSNASDESEWGSNSSDESEWGSNSDEESEWNGEYDDGEYDWLNGVLGEDSYFSVSSSSNNKIAVQITADQADTYPASTRNRIASPNMYPLPKGAVDYTNGKTISINSGGVLYRHLILASGYRVDVNDVKKVDSGPKNNSISGLSVSNKSGYTYLSLNTKQKVTYAIRYTGKEFIIRFDNTTSIPNRNGIASNPMFSNATWSKNTLTLTLAKQGGFMGYKGYYDGNNLVFRFNNPPTSIKNAKIYVDPGHGGTDTGAIGRNPTVYEKNINAAIAKQVAAELQSRGATIMMYDQKKNIRMPARVKEAEAWGADMIVSIHCNTSTNTAAKGTEVYYFYPFSRQLAANAALNVSKQFGSDNRGTKSGIYHITLSSQVPGVLVETGFLTNKSDYDKLLKASYHRKIAVGVANSVEGAIKTAATGKASNGTEFKSPGTATGGSDVSTGSSDSGSSNSSKVTAVRFSQESMEIKIGESVTLKPEYTPSVLKNVPFTWRVANSSRVSVDENGRITGISAGTTTVTATADDGSKKSASIRITVLKESVSTQPEINASGVALSSAGDAYLDEEYISLYPGNKYRIEIFSDYGDVIRGSDFKWSSDNTNVATVDSNGIVTARSTGDAVVTATGGGYTFICEVEVSRTKVAVSGISLDEKNVTVVRNKNYTLTATVTPRNAADQTIAWSSSDTKVATVNARGVVTGKSEGKATITAKTKSGGYSATCTVEVLSKAVELEEITTTFPEIEMFVGDTDNMDVHLIPENATVDTGINYTSSNSNVASIDSEGNIKALARGTTTVTAMSKTNSRIRTSIRITVLE